jgi:fibronectin type 3 domain-containing protein/predicted small lipoprotein YifL
MTSRPPWLLPCRAAAFLLTLLCVVPACGRKGPPLPPLPVVPTAVADFQAEPRDAGIVLRWTRPTRNQDGSPLTDLVEFRIFRATGAPGTTSAPASAFSLLATVRADRPDNATLQGSLYAYQDDAGGHGLNTGRQYRYRVQAVNRRGEIGPSSADMAVDFTAASASPVALAAMAGDGTVDLTWQAPPGGDPAIRGYNVYRGTASGGYDPQPINAKPVVETRFRDAGVENNISYYYVVRSVTNERPPWRESADSGEVSVIPQDFIPPAPPRGLVAIPGERDVALTWNAGTERDILGYLVYRRELPAVAATRLTDTPVPGTTYTDRSVRPGATYAYTVTAVDRSARQNESAPSTEVEISLP